MKKWWQKEPFEPHRMTEREQAAIEATAQGILNVRRPYLDAGRNLAWLYDPETMPDDLRRAHDANDVAVDAAYGIRGPITEAERVAFLFRLHQWQMENHASQGCLAI